MWNFFFGTPISKIKIFEKFDFELKTQCDKMLIWVLKVILLGPNLLYKSKDPGPSQDIRPML